MRASVRFLGRELLEVELQVHDQIGNLAAAIATLARAPSVTQNVDVDVDTDDNDPPFEGGHTVACVTEREVVWPEPDEGPPDEEGRRTRPRGFGFDRG